MSEHFIHQCQAEFPVPKTMQGMAVALGNFDGVHKGHQSVLGFALNKAKLNGLKTMMLTFEPHPQTRLVPDKPVYRLSMHDKKALLARLVGLDGILSLDFTKGFSNQSREWFIDHILLDTLQVKHVFAGYDFHFGKGRQGTPEFLQAQGALHGFGVTIVDMKSDKTGQAVSSTRIRHALKDGQIELANQLLGYHHFVSGTALACPDALSPVRRYEGRIQLSANDLMKPGYYAVQLVSMFGTTHPALARISTSGSGKYLYYRLIDSSQMYVSQRVHVMFYRRLSEEDQVPDGSPTQLRKTIEIATQQHTHLDIDLYSYWSCLPVGLASNPNACGSDFAPRLETPIS